MEREEEGGEFKKARREKILSHLPCEAAAF
jgi:hypothetical protein